MAAGSCTLTQDDFEPAPARSATLTPAGGGGSVNGPAAGAAGSSGVGVPCGDSVQCEPGFACVDARCVLDSCVESEDVSACEIESCLDGDCGSNACSDGERGPAETDVDCGGACEPCPIDGACVVAADCVNALCVSGLCREATCDDGVTNQDESGPDCGGALCGPCALGQSCRADADCGAGAFCAGEARACSPISCQDRVQNGAELSIDCGGGACPGCDVGSACNDGADCNSGSCGAGGLCAAPSCTDGAKNQDEVDVDCGGSCPAACATGRACSEGGDCESRVCGTVNCAAGSAQCCQAPSCGDGVANGTEPVVDCGNAQCGACALGHPCTANAQCQTGSCGPGATCVVPLLCDDDRRNGLEGDIDCGGTEAGCPRCDDGQTCRVDGDCASSNCAANRCVSCNDGLQNGDEGGQDCGGSEPGCPACIRCNELNSVDLGTVGFVTTLPANSCARITQFPGYAPTLVDSFEIGPFPLTFTWAQACSGQSGSSSFDAPYQRRSLTGMSIDCPIVFDLRGSDANLQMRWW